MDNLNEWDQASPKAEISVSQLKQLIADMRNKKEKYDQAKKISNDLYHEFREAEQLVIGAMEVSGQQKFSVPGMGSLSLVNKYQVTVPKDLEAKRKLFGWLESQYGAEVKDEYVSINYQSLNSIYKTEAEIAEREGRDFSIPGVDDPTVKIETRWRSEKK